MGSVPNNYDAGAILDIMEDSTMPYSTIQVLFIDASTKKPFGQSDVPLTALPETFALETTMHLGNQDWQVIGAEPMTAA